MHIFNYSHVYRHDTHTHTPSEHFGVRLVLLDRGRRLLVGRNTRHAQQKPRLRMDELRTKRLARFDMTASSTTSAAAPTLGAPNGMILPHRQKASLDPDLLAAEPTGGQLPSSPTLLSPPPSPPAFVATDDAEKELAMAIALSLEPQVAPCTPQHAARPRVETPGAPARARAATRPAPCFYIYPVGATLLYGWLTGNELVNPHL